jgi:multidrug resistance efflux pump
MILLLLPLFVFGKVHYAKVEPLERTTIKSSVSGTIVKVDVSSEGKFAGDEAVIQIDDAMDKINLNTSKESLVLMDETLEINQQILEGLQKTYELKKSYFNRVNALSTSTKTQKDNAYSAFIGAKNQLLGTKEKVISLKKQILDIGYKVDMLKDTISKKSITLKGRYLYKIMVRAGEFAAPGMPLAIADNLSKAKLTIYLDSDEVKDIKNRKIYINSEESEVKISRIWKEADEKFISSYKAEIILEPKYPFSSLLKIEIK